MFIETIKHFFGFCGEGHLNIFHIIGYGLAPFIFMYTSMKLFFVSIKNKITNKFKNNGK
jgi:hypothetical protein